MLVHYLITSETLSTDQKKAFCIIAMLEGGTAILDENDEDIIVFIPDEQVEWLESTVHEINKVFGKTKMIQIGQPIEITKMGTT